MGIFSKRQMTYKDNKLEQFYDKYPCYLLNNLA